MPLLKFIWRGFFVGIRKCSLRTVVTELYYLREYQNGIAYCETALEPIQYSCGKQQKGIPFWEEKLTFGSPSCLDSSVQYLQIVRFVLKSLRFPGSRRAWAQPQGSSLKGDTQDLGHSRCSNSASDLKSSFVKSSMWLGIGSRYSHHLHCCQNPTP